MAVPTVDPLHLLHLLQVPRSMQHLLVIATVCWRLTALRASVFLNECDLMIHVWGKW